MSRHSKNCTAHSVFTYNEKKKLSGYGTVKETLGMDSFKAFHVCVLCLQPATAPCLCRQGHLFCRDCIISNLVMQKSMRQARLDQWTALNHAHQADQDKEQAKHQDSKQQNFYQMEYLADPALKGTSNQSIQIGKYYRQADEEQESRDQAVHKIRSYQREVYQQDTLTKTKANFWKTQNLESIVRPVGNPPSTKLLCPADDINTIRAKDLVKLQVRQDLSQKYMCELCRKELNYQKVQCLRECGHLFCKDCLQNVLIKEQRKADPLARLRCSCSKTFRPKEVLNVQEGCTAFTHHNEVVATKDNLAFLC